MKFYDLMALGYAFNTIRKAINNRRINRKERMAYEIPKYTEPSPQPDFRASTPFRFTDNFTSYDFEQIVRRVGKCIGRLTILSIDGPFVECLVLSSSGISEWEFQLDFNDYGRLTGNYWINTENESSSIPNRLGNLIREEILNRPAPSGNQRYQNTSQDRNWCLVCPYCGKQQTTSHTRFCVYCGKELM